MFKTSFFMTTAIQLQKLTAGKFFGEWLKCKIQLQRKSIDNGSSMALAVLHAMERRETSLLPNAAFLAAIYVDPRYQVHLKYSQKTVAPPHLAALWRPLQMLRESVDTTDVEPLDSLSES